MPLTNDEIEKFLGASMPTTDRIYLWFYIHPKDKVANSEYLLVQLGVNSKQGVIKG